MKTTRPVFKISIFFANEMLQLLNVDVIDGHAIHTLKPVHIILLVQKFIPFFEIGIYNGQFHSQSISNSHFISPFKYHFLVSTTYGQNTTS